jgi:hypothetical protein
MLLLCAAVSRMSCHTVSMPEQARDDITQCVLWCYHSRRNVSQQQSLNSHHKPIKHSVLSSTLRTEMDLAASAG